MDDIEKKAALHANNLHQVEEARGEVNRYYAGIYFRRALDPDVPGDMTDLMLYYIEHGGAVGHAERVAQRQTELASTVQKKTA